MSSHPQLGHGSSAKVQIRFLAHTTEQKEQIAFLYSEGRQDCCLFAKGDVESQSHAKQLLKQLGLDRESRGALESRWNIQWSNSWDVGAQGDARRRILFQCSCGYDQHARKMREKKKQGLLPLQIDEMKQAERRVPYEFTGCLAHVEITERESDGEITRITGHFEHNTKCKDAVLKRLPAVPLHEHVYEVALGQLENGASITAIQEMNRRMIEQKEYRGLENLSPEQSNVRYQLLPPDNATLYRKFSRRNGVDVRQKPQYNIHDWLDPNSPSFQPEIRNAIFHYSARSEAGERFQVCISTPDMDEAAWKYAHHSQVVLDGTFGVCSSRLLLFIALAQDENRKGVPLAFFLFSAPTGNRATHAGYNTQILFELLTHWKTHLSKNSKEPFTPYVGITDTDTKERGALLRVWPEILLLLCKFHLRQCWTNHCKTAMRCNSSDFWKDFVRNQLQKLECELISTSDRTAATELLGDYDTSFKQLLLDPTSAGAGRGGLKHIDYLTINWMPIDLWKSWSEFGRLAASTLLRVPVDGVIPTTNHLESFNSILKRKYLASALHSGHRLRFDSLIHLLITRILPNIFSHRKAVKSYNDWLITRFQAASGNRNIVDVHQEFLNDKDAAKKKPLAWWSVEVDHHRDAAARDILASGRITFFRPDADSMAATCTSSNARQAAGIKSTFVEYNLICCRSGEASCSCPDFQQRGGACKHLRSMRMAIENWVLNGQERPFLFPQTRLAAESCCKGQVAHGIIISNHIPANHTASLKSESDDMPLVSPPSLISPGIGWDPVLIQALGNDTTTVDDLEEYALKDEVDSEEESCKAGRLLDDLEGPEDSDTKFLPLAPSFNSSYAIEQQLQSKINHDVHRLLPTLHGLANQLSDMSNLKMTEELHELSALLCLIQLKLQPTQPSSSTHSQPTSISHDGVTPVSRQAVGGPARQHNKRADRPHLLPPSPERRQKRKDSHAPF